MTSTKRPQMTFREVRSRVAYLVSSECERFRTFFMTRQRREFDLFENMPVQPPPTDAELIDMQKQFDDVPCDDTETNIVYPATFAFGKVTQK